MKMKEKTFAYMALTIRSILLGLGFYYAFRVIRNNYYFPWIEQIEATNPPMYQCLRYLGHVIFLIGLVIYFIFVKDDRHCLSVAKFRKKDILFILLGLIGGFIMNGANIWIAILHGDIDMVNCEFNPLMIVASFFAVAVQSSTEEFESRMWTHKRIAAGAPAIYAFIGSSFTFAWSHMMNTGITLVAVINLFLHGILYALFMEITGSIWLSCAFHTMWNVTQNYIYGLPNSGYPAILCMKAPTFTNESFCYDPIFGVEGTYMGLIINIVVVAITYLIYKKQKSEISKSSIQ